MSTKAGMGGLNISLTKDGIMTYTNSLAEDEEAEICIDTAKCNILDGEGTAYYYFF